MTFSWKERPVLVTGATGLVGGHLIQELVDRKATVVAFLRNENYHSELYRADLLSRIDIFRGSLESYSDIENALSKYDIDTVFHLGAQTIVGAAYKKPLITFEANIRGTYNLLEACRSLNIKRVLVASSDKAYGTADHLPYTEETPLNGKFPYDVSKACTDLLASSYYTTYQLPLAIVRCGNIYGGGDLNWSRLIPGTIRSLLRGVPIVIRSNGTCQRDYIYVKDVVNAYVSLAEQLTKEGVVGEAFNFGPGRPLAVLDVVQQLQDLVGQKDAAIQILNQATAEIKHQFLSSEKARKILGWEMQYSLANGLQETIAWYDNYLGKRILSDLLTQNTEPTHA